MGTFSLLPPIRLEEWSTQATFDLIRERPTATQLEANLPTEIYSTNLPTEAYLVGPPTEARSEF